MCSSLGGSSEFGSSNGLGSSSPRGSVSRSSTRCYESPAPTGSGIPGLSPSSGLRPPRAATQCKSNNQSPASRLPNSTNSTQSSTTKSHPDDSSGSMLDKFKFFREKDKSKSSAAKNGVGSGEGPASPGAVPTCKAASPQTSQTEAAGAVGGVGSPKTSSKSLSKKKFGLTKSSKKEASPGPKDDSLSSPAPVTKASVKAVNGLPPAKAGSKVKSTSPRCCSSRCALGTEQSWNK